MKPRGLLDVAGLDWEQGHHRGKVFKSLRGLEMQLRCRGHLPGLEEVLSSYPVSTEGVGTRGGDIQGRPPLHSGLRSRLVCVRVCLSKMQK